MGRRNEALAIAESRRDLPPHDFGQCPFDFQGSPAHRWLSIEAKLLLAILEIGSISLGASTTTLDVILMHGHVISA